MRAQMFLKPINLDNNDFRQTLFSCNKCKRPLRAHDCDQLGLWNEELVNELRLDGLVIDFTAAGVLSELRDYERTVFYLKDSARAY